MEHKETLERLIEAINNGDDLENIEKLILHPMLNLNSTFGELGLRPIHHAVHKDRIDYVELMLQYGCNIQLRDQCGYSAIHFATRRGNLDMMNLLIRRGADVHAEDLLGFPPLHIALQKGNRECAILLLKNGANPNMYYKDLGYEIHLLRGDAPGCLEVLLEYGAKTTSVDVKGLTPLHAAVQSGNILYTYVLLKNGAEPNAVTSPAGRRKTDTAVGKTPLQIAAIAAEEKITELLLLFGADTNCRDNHLNTPLHFASAHGSTAIMTMLVKNGASVRALNERHFTPLHRACAAAPNHMNPEVLQLLLKYGAYANAFNSYDETPLHCLLSKSPECLNADEDEDQTTRIETFRELLLVLVNNQAKFSITNDPHDMFTILPYLPLVQNFQPITDLLLNAAHQVDISFSNFDIPDNLSPNLLLRIKDVSREPRSLKWFARKEIRRSLLNLEEQSLRRLPLPNVLKQYIVFRR
ncbi:Ankyrin-1 [Holothuria leucospilota]|uniref:Ankyrin-1 n=1 Tax=Holothuria leucospilota TaxID=206669 RepID=A0A9Q1BLE4_HOLLE|nr:Ankyrin-1 [Holothuria leucospilota]